MKDKFNRKKFRSNSFEGVEEIIANHPDDTIEITYKPRLSMQQFIGRATCVAVFGSASLLFVGNKIASQGSEQLGDQLRPQLESATTEISDTIGAKAENMDKNIRDAQEKIETIYNDWSEIREKLGIGDIIKDQTVGSGQTAIKTQDQGSAENKNIKKP